MQTTANEDFMVGATVDDKVFTKTQAHKPEGLWTHSNVGVSWANCASR